MAEKRKSKNLEGEEAICGGGTRPEAEQEGKMQEEGNKLIILSAFTCATGAFLLAVLTTISLRRLPWTTSEGGLDRMQGLHHEETSCLATYAGILQVSRMSMKTEAPLPRPRPGAGAGVNLDQSCREERGL